MTTPFDRLLAASRLLFGVLLLVGACRSADPAGPQTGSETHFLSWCVSDAACGDELECVCGVCTQICAGAESCQGLANDAECLAADRRPTAGCSAASATSTCDVACTDKGDCAGLGATARCDLGLCRRLGPDCEIGQTAGSDVVVLGDTFLAESGQIHVELTSLARASGSLQASEAYRDYSSTVITPFGRCRSKRPVEPNGRRWR
jgi:hypothetical protein